jgi:hypothetical protein
MTLNAFNIFKSTNSLIPSQDPGSVTGSQFINNNMNLKGQVRENNILQEFLHGNIPNFLRRFVSINLSNGINTLSLLVMPDYLSIGTDQDYVRIPMNPLTAQTIADKYDCSLPTRSLVNSIWKASENKITPKPWGPPYDNSMEDTYRYGVHNTTINNQLVDKNKFALTSGHKKDVVLTNKLYKNNPNHRVAIFGWIYPNGTFIQDLNATSHDDLYADYSHGIRLIANDVMIDNQPKRLSDIFNDPKLSSLVSDEGILKFIKY